MVAATKRVNARFRSVISDWPASSALSNLVPSRPSLNKSVLLYTKGMKEHGTPVFFLAHEKNVEKNNIIYKNKI